VSPALQQALARALRGYRLLRLGRRFQTSASFACRLKRGTPKKVALEGENDLQLPWLARAGRGESRERQMNFLEILFSALWIR